MGRACAGEGCCATSLVPGGTFKRSYDGLFGYDDPTFVATVSDFRLDTYEITVGRFRAFVDEYPKSLPANFSGRNPNDPMDVGWEEKWNREMPLGAVVLRAALGCDAQATWTDAPSDAETKPITCLTWYEAFAFCVWDGGRLPTEAEWNYAAAGGSEQRAYPWSSTPKTSGIDETHAVFDLGVATPSAVGSKPDGKGKWGHADLSGNVAEWTRDWAQVPYRVNPCNDCGEHTKGDPPARILRGGGADYPPELVRTAWREFAEPSVRRSNIGARCAR